MPRCFTFVFTVFSTRILRVEKDNFKLKRQKTRETLENCVIQSETSDIRKELKDLVCSFIMKYQSYGVHLEYYICWARNLLFQANVQNNCFSIVIVMGIL